jgi:hypothetical protein
VRFERRDYHEALAMLCGRAEAHRLEPTSRGMRQKHGALVLAKLLTARWRTRAREWLVRDA